MFLNVDTVIHAANVFYLLAFTVRDIVWLRVLSVMASICLITYFYLQPEPLMIPIYWNTAFLTLNMLWIFILLAERRPVRLNADEQRLCELVFRFMSPREMIKLLRLGTWETASTDEYFVQKGEKLDRLMVMFDGRACVEVDGKYVAELQPGQFIGSISYLTEQNAPASIVALEPTRYVSWNKGTLEVFMKKNPELHSTLKTILAVDLTQWLKATWARKAA